MLYEQAYVGILKEIDSGDYGLDWVLIEDNFDGLDDVRPIENGDHLIILDRSEKRILFDGVIDRFDLVNYNWNNENDTTILGMHFKCS
jgi:hypothetical protein